MKKLSTAEKIAKAEAVLPANANLLLVAVTATQLISGQVSAKLF